MCIVSLDKYFWTSTYLLDVHLDEATGTFHSIISSCIYGWVALFLEWYKNQYQFYFDFSVCEWASILFLF
jgi:hypothetical protein